MKYRNSPILVCLLLSTALLIMAPKVHAQTGGFAFEDQMNYANDSAIQSAWSSVTGAAPTRATSVSLVPTPLASLNPSLSGGTFMALGNGVRYRNIHGALNNDWTLRARLLSTQYSRSQCIFLLNAAGTQGYGIMWGTTNVNQNSGRGLVSIRKFNNSSYTDWSSFGTGTQLGTAPNSGHPVTGYPVTAAPSSNQDTATYNTGSWQDFLEVALNWDRESGKLTLYANGLEVASAVDTSYTSFSRVYVRGNTSGYFDGITVSADYGADLPFTTIEAESLANSTNGIRTVLTNKTQMSTWPPTPAQEASGYGFVELTNNGHRVDFVKVPACNSMVIRHCTPDASNGGGATSTLSLYVNGTFRQSISLSSKYNWLYSPSSPSWSNGQSNTPTGTPHVFWDETPVRISGAAIVAGDTIRLQIDTARGDNADFYRIDLVDFEVAPDALARPSGSLSVVDYGATGTGTGNDHSAFTNCINAAKQSSSKVVWVPTGTYYIGANLPALDGVKIRGAGMWHTVLKHNHTNSSARMFSMTGNGPEVSDLMIDSQLTTARNTAFFYGFNGSTGTNWSIRRVWVMHSGAAMWLSGSNGVIEDCRIRCVYADGININSGNATASADNIRVENNHIRGLGDDGLAILDEAASSGATTNVTMRRNTVVSPWWGLSADLAAGSGHIMEYNLLAGGPGLGINLPSSYPMKALSNSVFRNNALVRCGRNQSGQARGAIWILPSSNAVSSTTMEGNFILDPLFKGFHAAGGAFNQHITFRNNLINAPGTHGVRIDSGAKGSGTFQSNTVTNYGTATQFSNAAPGSAYTVTQSGNSW